MSPHTCFLCARSVQAKQKKVTRSPGDSRLPPYNQTCSPMCNSRPTQPSKTHYKINSYQRFSYER